MGLHSQWYLESMRQAPPWRCINSTRLESTSLKSFCSPKTCSMLLLRSCFSPEPPVLLMPLTRSPLSHKIRRIPFTFPTYCAGLRCGEWKGGSSPLRNTKCCTVPAGRFGVSSRMVTGSIGASSSPFLTPPTPKFILFTDRAPTSMQSWQDDQSNRPIGLCSG
ncbi:unnamed protein product [Ectocarpus sp. CCAP 1310/34]|nr:unnamed protein product [Ectocarpus sp. CCAP 1310/34]